MHEREGLVMKQNSRCDSPSARRKPRIEIQFSASEFKSAAIVTDVAFVGRNRYAKQCGEACRKSASYCARMSYVFCCLSRRDEQPAIDLEIAAVSSLNENFAS
jgi:hypothetical protein